MTNSEQSLIQKLEKSRPKGSFSDPENIGYVKGYRDAFDIVRQHQEEEYFLSKRRNDK